MTGTPRDTSNARPILHRQLACTLILLATACAGGLPTGPDVREPLDPPPAPVPGWVQLQLTTPWTDDGAVQLTVVGGVVLEVALSSGLGGYASVMTQGVVRLLVTGQISSGTVARLRVPDVNRITGLQVHVGQVAQRGTYALRSTADGYQAAVAR